MVLYIGKTSTKFNGDINVYIKVKIYNIHQKINYKYIIHIILFNVQ